MKKQKLYPKDTKDDGYFSITSIWEPQKKSKTNTKWLKIAIPAIFLTVVISTIVLLYKTPNNPRPTLNLKGIKYQNSNPIFSMYLTIPSINVKALVEHVKITPTGEMGVPTNIEDVGWFSLGVLPGELGSAVISGHLNGPNGEIGIFANLHKLKVGDSLYFDNGKGDNLTFIVRETRIYEPGKAEDVFNKNDNAHLNLITCEGGWDEIKNTYSKRLVVFADISK